MPDYTGLLSSIIIIMVYNEILLQSSIKNELPGTSPFVSDHSYIMLHI